MLRSAHSIAEVTRPTRQCRVQSAWEPDGGLRSKKINFSHFVTRSYFNLQDMREWLAVAQDDKDDEELLMETIRRGKKLSHH